MAYVELGIDKSLEAYPWHPKADQESGLWNLVRMDEALALHRRLLLDKGE
jgi:hypothetical protein